MMDPGEVPSMILPSVNFHVTRACNARCSFCFATFRDVPDQLPLDDARRLVRALAAAGVEKLNFAGGEPTLHRGIGVLLRDSRELGLVTSIVSNGARMGALLDLHAADLDWVGLSVDSAHEATEGALGRSRGRHVVDEKPVVERQAQPHLVDGNAGLHRPAPRVLERIGFGIDEIAFDVPQPVVAPEAVALDASRMDRLARGDGRGQRHGKRSPGGIAAR
jgi:hypothetical protein